MEKSQKIRIFNRVLLYMAVLLICVSILAPYTWLIISSLSYRVDLTSIPLHWIPQKINFDNYQQIFMGGETSSSPNGNLRFGFLNSLIIAGSSTLICLFAGTLAAYAFTRLKFFGKKPLYLLILVTQFLPLAVLIIPLYIIMKNLGLLNTRFSLIMANCSFILPMMIWLMRSYFTSVPKDLEEVARIDGCSRLGTIFRIIIPLSTPGLAASGIFAFVIAWNEFFTAFILSSTLNSKTISVLLSEFSSKVGIDYVALAAAGVISSLPPVIMALIFQKYIVQGLTGGAVKG